MAIINYTDQLKYAGRGYLDAKMMPVKSVDDLKSISLSQRFEGLTVTVLNDGSPQDYWLVGGVTNANWVPKTVTTFDDLRLVLEDGFLKLENNGVLLGDAVDLNSFFPESPDVPENDLYIETVDYVTEDEVGKVGIFMRFIYSDGTMKYLDMSQFLSNTYDAGSGIVIEGNVISLDSAVSGRIEALETAIEEVKASTEETKTSVASLAEKVAQLNSQIEGIKPDGKTIGFAEDSKALHVKVLNEDGNMLQVSTNESGESGLFAGIPIFYEDEELK